jgi:hypothetical protein
MRVQQIARALTLSVALTAIGVIAAPAPASAAGDRKEVKTRVKIQRVHSNVVKGVVRSPEKDCEWHRHVWLVDDSGRRYRTLDPLAGLRARFTLNRVIPVVEASTFRVVAPRSVPRERSWRPIPGHGGGFNRSFKCKADRSRWLTFPPPSEAGIAAAPASAPEDVREVKTRLRITFMVGSPGGELFVKGRVRSPEQRCVNRRIVKFIGERAGNLHGRANGDRTLRGGRFTLLLHDPTPRERYRLKALRSFRLEGSLKCKPDVKRFRP